MTLGWDVTLDWEDGCVCYVALKLRGGEGEYSVYLEFFNP